MSQFKKIFVWKCLACGRVLTTPGGGAAAYEKMQIHAKADRWTIEV